MNLSCVILTKNEESDLERCLKSVSFADEIVIVDDDSKDKTLEIAGKYNCRIYKKKLEDDFSKQRNFGLSKTKGKWVLFIDPDEEASNQLKNEIIQVVSNPFNTKSAYFLKRKDFLFGKKLNFGEWGKIKLLRRARKDSGKWERKVHEVWKTEGEKDVLKSELFHYSHKNLREFISKINYFSSLHAKANSSEDKKSNVFKIIFFPFLKFLNNWILKGGYKDGNHGFVISLIMSFHSFLSWSKLWLKEK